MKKNGFTLIIFLIIIMALGAGTGVATFLLKKQKTVQPVPSPSYTVQSGSNQQIKTGGAGNSLPRSPGNNNLPPCPSETASGCQKTSNPVPSATSSFFQKLIGNQNLSQAERDGKELSNGRCVGTEKRKLGTLPMRMEDFSMIIPYGVMIDGHVTPVDHQYFSPTVFRSPRDTYEVRAMADATIVDVEPGEQRNGNIRLVFSISCNLFYYYDLLTSLAPDIKAGVDKAPGSFSKQVAIPVKEGQLIGRIGGQTLDFAVWDMDVVLPGFLIPEHYRSAETWKIHTADPLNYYTDSLKKQALAKYLRTVEPVSGKVDYDIDGKLVGTWFKEGAGGYGGGGSSQDYYKAHLSVVYDHLDPSSIVVSIGDFAGQPQQFGVNGNSPDPKDVGITSSLVKYELVKKDWVDPATGTYWDRFSLVKGLRAKNNEEFIQGTVLFQLIENRKLKMEIFPGKTAGQVSAFTDQAAIYER